MAALLSSAGYAQTTTWDRISHYLSLLKLDGFEGLVAQECPAGLMGAFNKVKQALLMCGNNLQDDQAQVWVVLAHESARLVQVLPPNQVEALFVKHCSNRLSP